MNWNDLRYVLALSRSGTLASTARKLKVNETTVSRRLARIDQALGARLFDRVDGRFLPTDAGRRVVAQAERVELAVTELASEVAGKDADVSGVVRVTTIPLLANRLLVPALERLYRRHPGLRIELSSDPRNLDVTKREADVALRPARPYREHQAVARRIGELAYAVYGSASVDAASLPWIAFDEGMAALPHVAWIARAVKREGSPPPRLLVNDGDVALHATVSGLGKSLLPCAIGDRTPGVKRLSGRAPVLSRELWLIVHPELRRLPRIRAVMEWIEQIMQHGKPRLPGRTTTS